MKTLHMPRIDPAMEKGIVLRWLKRAGERVRRGDVVAVILAEKVEYEYTTPYDGTVGRLLVAEGDEVPVGTPIMEIMEEGEAAPIREEPAKPEVLASPAARRLAREHGVDLREIRGTGPGGRITSEDVEEYVKRSRVAASTIRLSPMMRVVAERMARSHREIPPVTIFMEVSMDKVWELKAQQGGPLEAYILYALSRVLRDFPLVNGLYQDGAVIAREDVNIAFAVAVGEDLYTPVVKRCNEKSFEEIRGEVDLLLERARNRRLTIEDIKDATFTVTNLGPYGVDAFTPIIPPGQTAILGVGEARERPLVREGMIRVGRVAVFSLTFDHRVMNGAMAAAFLTALKGRLEGLTLET